MPPAKLSGKLSGCFCSSDLRNLNLVILLNIILSYFPSFIGIVPVHALKLLQGIGPEIFLVHGSVGANDEGLDSRNPILGRCCCQGESADHCSFHDKVHLAQGAAGPCPFKTLK